MQKRILFSTLIVLVIASTANGQIKKGAVLLGGNIGFSTQKTDDPFNTAQKTTNFVISPAFGRAVKENLIVGFDLNYSYYKNESNIPNIQTTNGYGLGVFIRRYKELGKGFYLFGQGRIGGTYNNTKNDIHLPAPPSEYQVKGFSIDAGIYPGIAYAVSNKLQLETGFNNLVYASYSHTNNEGTDLKTNSFAIGSSLSNFSGLTIGFRVLLN